MAALGRIYEDFKPTTEWVKEPTADVFVLRLPGFTKDQLRVQLSPFGVLNISGERPLGGNRWQRFQEEVGVPENCDTGEITAKFERSTLYIRQPKSVVPDEQQHQQPAPSERAPAPVTPPIPTPAPSEPAPAPAPVTPPRPTPAPFPAPQKMQEKEEEAVNRMSGEAVYRKKGEAEKVEGEGSQQGKRYGVLVPKQKLVGGMFKELSKSGNSKRLIQYVVLALALVLFLIYVKNYARNKGEDIHDL